MMDYDSFFNVTVLPADIVNPKAEVHILRIHEVIGIELTYLLKNGPADHQACTRNHFD
jgi:hypothetical protein